MGVIAKYKFNQNLYANFIPEFNSGFTYTITDETDIDGCTIRTIESDSLPQRIKFGESASSYVEKGVQSLIEILFVDIHNGMTNFNGFLANAINLISVNTDGWDTSEATNMQYMFHNCSKLISLDVSNFNTEKVTNMANMFQSCSSLISLNVSNFDTSQVNNMNAMFSNCSSLTSLDVSSFDVSQTKDMTFMFAGSSLTSLDLSSFKINQTTIISHMFRLCNNLTFLDISNFDIDDNNGIEQLFYNALHITDIGMVYCNSSTINKIVNLLTTNTTIWYNDANLSDLTVKDNITYKKYQSTTLSLNEPIQLRNIGDVHDEINYETGEYIQRIGEIVFDGSEDENWYMDMLSNDDTRLNMTFKVDLDNIIDYNFATTGMLCDRFIQVTGSSLWSNDVQGIGSSNGSGIKIGIPKSNLTTQDVNGFRYWLSQNPITIQYQLAQPIITKIDTTILDQSNSYKSSQQTYDESTYISVQSDTVVTPTSNIDYEIYSSTGTITGTSATIENAEAGTPVSGVVYGETLLNVIQEPSETEYVITGDAFEEQSGTLENTIEGNIKSAILMGNTLVNIKGEETNQFSHSTARCHNDYILNTIKDNTEYLILYDLTITDTIKIGFLKQTSNTEVAWIDSTEYVTSSNGKIILNSGTGTKFIRIISSEDNTHEIKHLTIIEYQEGMENWDIPYFEGMQSVNLYPSQKVLKITWKSGKYYNDNGELIWGESFHRYFDEYVEIHPNHVYTVSGNNNYKNLNFYDENKNHLLKVTGKSLWGDETLKDDIYATAPTNAKYMRYNMAVSSGMDEDTTIFDTTLGTLFMTTSMDEIDSHKAPILQTTGKNLFNFSINNVYTTSTSSIYTPILNNDKSITLKSIFTYPYGLRQGFYVEEGKQYTITVKGMKNNNDYSSLVFGGDDLQYGVSNTYTLVGWATGGNCITTINTYGTNKIVCTALKTGYITRFLIHGIGEVTYSIFEFQVEEGNIGTSYEPRKTNILSVNEELHLRKVGEVKDELDLLVGEKVERIGEVVLDGSQDGGYEYATDESLGLLVLKLPTIPDIINTGANVYGLLSDKYASITSKNPNNILSYNGRIMITKSLSELESFDTADKIKSFLSQNPITVQYPLATPTIKTVSTTILDQDDNTTENLHTFDTITHINTYAQGGGLIPFVNIPENISYDVLLKENTQYTIKLNRTNIIDGTPLTVNLGGTELSIEDSADSFTIATPSTLTNNTLSIGGANNKVKEVMVIEGDYVDRDLDYFEGFIHVENPIVSTIGKNLMPTMDKYNPDEYGSSSGNGTTSFKYNHEVGGFYTDVHRNIFAKGIIGLKPNTTYTISVDALRNPNSSTVYEYGFLWQSPTNLMVSIDNLSTTEWKRFSTQRTTDDNGKFQGGCSVYKGLYFNNIQIEEGTTATLYEPYQGNILTTYPQVTLRSIGDIKDEWDVVGETVTRRIGKIVLDGTYPINLSLSSDTYAIFTFDTKNKKYGLNYISNWKTGGFGNAFLSTPTEERIGHYDDASTPDRMYISILKSKLSTADVDGMNEYLAKTPITFCYQYNNIITESVRITPPNPQTSTASITIPTQLNHVEDTSDFLVWNPYKEHYVRYNYVEDGVVLDSYTWENLTDLNERQFVEFYNRRTYIDQPYHSYVASHDSKGTSKYVLIEPNQDYTVNVRFSELPTCETVKVNLGGAEVEMSVNDPHVHVTTPNTLLNNLCSISGDGLDGKVTDILVIHCLEHEGFADIDYFEGVDGIGEIVEVDGVEKASIVMEQTNGNLIDKEFEIWNNGQSIKMSDDERLVVHPNTKYVVKFRRNMDKELAYTIYVQLFNKDNVQTRIVNGEATEESNTREFTTNHDETMARLYSSKLTNNGSTHRYWDVDLCYANMSKDYIRPRYYDKEEILLPMQLHRINTVYDNFYYDEMKGFYRIQQSIGHKYFVGADSENWTLIERGQRVLRFRYNNADIQMKSLGEFMTNRLPNGTATSPYECCAFSGSTFIVSIDKERLTSESLIAFKEWLANNNLHLYYQLASPLMIDLPQYPNRIEFNTYKDEIYTFFKNCKPTVFTLAVPLDQTYRFYDLEEGQGYANRIELTDERMTEEDKSYVHTIYGSGISNLIEEPNNVDTMLKPNYEGKATSHSLTNGQVSTIGVHGFEANDVTIENYNTVTKQYELTVQAQQGTNTNTETLAVPYKLEIYEDGTKDRVYYNSQYKQWMFEGGQTLTVPYNTSTGAFTSVVEVFRGLQPRSGLIGEFKVRFASGTTSARLYYSINGTTYGYTTLRGMTDEVDYYIGFFNTGGTKIDMGTKIDANAEYTTLVPINATIPECLMINQIQSTTECTYYQDKTYYYSDVVSPLLLDVYNGTTTITELNGAVIDIQNNAHNKQALIYGDTTYTVYWTYVGGEGNIKVTLGGVTQEVAATQGYVTITTSDTDLERGLFIGGFDVTIKDLMLIKGERITDLKYFEGSRAVGTAFTDEDGNTMYKITFVTGSELINDKFEDMITFEDNKKHNVVVTKLLGAKPDKN